MFHNVIMSGDFDVDALGLDAKTAILLKYQISVWRRSMVGQPVQVASDDRIILPLDMIKYYLQERLRLETPKTKS